jgi:hypothetical protein
MSQSLKKVRELVKKSGCTLQDACEELKIPYSTIMSAQRREKLKKESSKPLSIKVVDLEKPSGLLTRLAALEAKIKKIEEILR